MKTAADSGRDHSRTLLEEVLASDVSLPVRLTALESIQEIGDEGIAFRSRVCCPREQLRRGSRESVGVPGPGSRPCGPARERDEWVDRSVPGDDQARSLPAGDLETPSGGDAATASAPAESSLASDDLARLRPLVEALIADRERE